VIHKDIPSTRCVFLHRISAAPSFLSHYTHMLLTPGSRVVADGIALFLHCCYAVVTLCLHCCYTRYPCCCRLKCTVLALFLHCCYAVLTLLSHQVAVLLQTAVRQPGSTAAVYDLFKDLLGV
jgi:hypothetical protein